MKGQGTPASQKQGFARTAAPGRPGRPEDVAAAVAMLVGPDAGWGTGQDVRADGGLIRPMKPLVRHGRNSVPGGVKPTDLKDHGHAVVNRALPHRAFSGGIADGFWRDPCGVSGFLWPCT